MTDKDFYDRIDKTRSLFTSREAVTRYCQDIRMLEDTEITDRNGLFVCLI